MLAPLTSVLFEGQLHNTCILNLTISHYFHYYHPRPSQLFSFKLLQKASSWYLGSLSCSPSNPDQNLPMATHRTQNKIHLLISAFKVLLLSPTLFLPFCPHMSHSGHTGPLVGPEISELPPPSLNLLLRNAAPAVASAWNMLLPNLHLAPFLLFRFDSNIFYSDRPPNLEKAPQPLSHHPLVL